MKNKIFIMLLMSMLLCIGTAMAAISTTIDSPATDDTPGTPINFTVSTTGHGKLANCTLTLTSTETANTSVTIMNEQLNDSGQTDQVNLSYVSLNALEDGLYTAAATCRNSSDDSAAANTVEFEVDNTIPQAPTGLSPTSGTDGTAINSWTSTVIGENVTACVLYTTNQYGDVQSYTMTHSGNTCTYGSYLNLGPGSSWYVAASDGTNTTNSATTELTISKEGGGAAIAYVMKKKAEQATVSAKTSKWLETGNNKMIALGVLIALGYAAYAGHLGAGARKLFK